MVGQGPSPNTLDPQAGAPSGPGLLQPPAAGAATFSCPPASSPFFLLDANTSQRPHPAQEATTLQPRTPLPSFYTPVTPPFEPQFGPPQPYLPHR